MGAAFLFAVTGLLAAASVPPNKSQHLLEGRIFQQAARNPAIHIRLIIIRLNLTAMKASTPPIVVNRLSTGRAPLTC
jgi:hypothetical protein